MYYCTNPYSSLCTVLPFCLCSGQLGMPGAILAGRRLDASSGGLGALPSDSFLLCHSSFCTYLQVKFWNCHTKRQNKQLICITFWFEMQLQSLVMGLSPKGSKVPQGLWGGRGGGSSPSSWVFLHPCLWFALGRWHRMPGRPLKPWPSCR